MKVAISRAARNINIDNGGKKEGTIDTRVISRQSTIQEIESPAYPLPDSRPQEVSDGQRTLRPSDDQRSLRRLEASQRADTGKNTIFTPSAYLKSGADQRQQVLHQDQQAAEAKESEIESRYLESDDPHQTIKGNLGPFQHAAKKAINEQRP